MKQRYDRFAGLFVVRERRRWKNMPAAPPPPDPVATGNAQTASNISTAVANAKLGNINQKTPFGSTTFSQTGGYTDPKTGQWVPSYTETQKLNPTLNSILTGTENTASSLVPTGQTLANEAGTSLTTPLNPNGANNTIIQGGPEALYGPAATAAFNAGNIFLQPQFTQQQTDLQDQLARQGIPVGSSAYGNAETNLRNSQNQETAALENQAINQGITAGNNMFGLAVQGQNQQLGQQQLLQQNPLTLLSALYGGGPVSAAGTGGTLA
jgi:hypothetical protein